MGVGHPDKRMDKMAQDAIDAMSGSNRSTRKKSSSGNTLMTLVWALIIVLILIFAGGK